MKTIAVIPVFRDVENTIKVIQKFSQNVVDEICIIMDCVSKNDIERIELTNCPVDIHIIRNEKRKGIGYAIRQGLQYAIDRGFRVVVILAGNNKDNPSEIPRLLEPITKKDYDYVQGSRFLPGGKSVKNPFFRGVFSRLYPFIWTMLTSIRCTDVTNGFRAYKLAIFKDPRININQNWLDNYELEYFIHYKVLTLGYKIQEIPVSKVYSHRDKGGYSKISPFRDWWKIVGPLLYLKIGARK